MGRSVTRWLGREFLEEGALAEAAIALRRQSRRRRKDRVNLHVAPGTRKVRARCSSCATSGGRTVFVA